MRQQSVRKNATLGSCILLKLIKSIFGTVAVSRDIDFFYLKKSNKSLKLKILN